MAEAQRLTSVEIDPYASEPSKPFGIITADLRGTREFDDGIAVTPLPSASEMYRVNVFVVDTSALYFDDAIAEEVIERKETLLEYPEDGSFVRTPMIDGELARQLHFAKNNGVLGALVVSFIVGKWCPPTDISITHGNVEVTDNYNYARFGGMCRDKAQFKGYGRAASQIMKHLNAKYCDDEVIYNSFMSVPRNAADLRGININRAFMLAANHFTARVMRDEGRPIINRTNFFDETDPLDTKPQPLARFSTTPGPHQCLGFDAYARMTSPLRLADAFMTMGQLRLRADGQEVGNRDRDLLDRTVTALNQPLRIARPVAA